ncbi:glycerol-3-phosphate dehydrogenase [Micractinium conductrix]|uniref:Glycerol-3-phosphate dehydrogenase [NAD(+)] n=1 Tax=Micractinium conductrix TaxID=554055 RepID=A0A2P6V6Q7_9CHLO|nr:glycerol-3-phosphate dehydrogenase [Micractinium conductrix]|eukprot:PSC69774.1 glycerol-3-phosphate dehydrogenase [Micractinium conductrix]
MSGGLAHQPSGLSSERTRVSVLGGGAWGTALALHAARMGHEVLIWALEPEVAKAINEQHENTTYLKGHQLPHNLRASNDIKEVAGYGELVLMVIPTPFVERTVSQIEGSVRDDAILVSCTKGILNDTLETPNEILKRVLPPRLHTRLAYLSGPSFAAEVAKEHPTAVTIAAEDDGVAKRVQELMSTSRFRCYRTHDVIGVELGGALKNVLAIACGISDGLGFGSNGRAAIITRGLDEITRLAVAAGASPLTLAGLSGIGDIVLTCTGDLSRNRTVGIRLGKGEKLEDITATMGGAVAEGVLTSRSTHHLAQKKGIECPVLEGIYRVIHEGADPVQVQTENMSRPLKAEVDARVAMAAHHAEVPAPPPAPPSQA